MSSFWSIWITVLTLATLVGCIILLRWCLTNFAGVEEGEPMDHEFDGIQELNNPLPRWWSIFFMVTIIWGFVYLAAYPGLGNFEGLLKWKSANFDVTSLADSEAQISSAKAAGMLVQYDREVSQANAKYGPIFARFAEYDVETIVEMSNGEEGDEDTVLANEALKVGQRLFLQNCSQCHGSDAKGTTGFPNLTDNDWLYGGDPHSIKQTLLNGRIAAGMISWESMLGDEGIKEVVAYVISLNPDRASKVDPALAAKGKEKFAMCAACHGPEGQGSNVMGIPLGAPTLHDNIWLYGASERAIESSIRNGRAGVMPAWKDILGEDKVHVISAYVYSLSQDK